MVRVHRYNRYAVNPKTATFAEKRKLLSCHPLNVTVLTNLMPRGWLPGSICKPVGDRSVGVLWDACSSATIVFVNKPVRHRAHGWVAPKGRTMSYEASYVIWAVCPSSTNPNVGLIPPITNERSAPLSNILRQTGMRACPLTPLKPVLACHRPKCIRWSYLIKLIGVRKVSSTLSIFL